MDGLTRNEPISSTPRQCNLKLPVWNVLLSCHANAAFISVRLLKFGCLLHGGWRSPGSHLAIKTAFGVIKCVPVMLKPIFLQLQAIGDFTSNDFSDNFRVKINRDYYGAFSFHWHVKHAVISWVRKNFPPRINIALVFSGGKCTFSTINGSNSKTAFHEPLLRYHWVRKWHHHPGDLDSNSDLTFCLLFAVAHALEVAAVEEGIARSVGRVSVRAAGHIGQWRHWYRSWGFEVGVNDRETCWPADFWVNRRHCYSAIGNVWIIVSTGGSRRQKETTWG